MREIVWKGWGGEERFREGGGGGVQRRGRRENNVSIHTELNRKACLCAY